MEVDPISPGENRGGKIQGFSVSAGVVAGVLGLG